MSQDNVPTSEVGSALPTESNITALIEQNRNLMDIIKNLQTPRNPTTNDKLKRVTLPKFDPDGAEADASAWCTTVDLIMADNVVEGSDLVMALSKALEGSASQWYALQASLGRSLRSCLLDGLLELRLVQLFY